MSLEIELENEMRRQLQEGIKLARNGDKAEAAEIFNRILSANPDHEDGLVWLAAVTEDRAEAVRCLKRALKVNPNNRRAQAGLEWAERRLESEPPQVAPSKPAIPPPASDEAASSVVIPFQHPRPKSEPKGADNSQSSSASPGLKSSIAASPPLGVNRKSSIETIDQPPPYKKRRLPNQPPEFVLPPEALPQTPERPAEKPPRKRFGRRQAPALEESSVLEAAAPKIAVTVSDRVRLGVSGFRTEESNVKVGWPLLLFLIALALALLTFVVSALAPLFGGLALLVALAGVVLFDRAGL